MWILGLFVSIGGLIFNGGKFLVIIKQYVILLTQFISTSKANLRGASLSVDYSQF